MMRFSQPRTHNKEKKEVPRLSLNEKGLLVIRMKAAIHAWFMGLESVEHKGYCAPISLFMLSSFKSL